MTMPQNPGQWPDPTGQPTPPNWPSPGDPVPPPPGPPVMPGYQVPPPGYAPPGYGAPGYGPQGYVLARRTNGMALAAMICSLVGIVSCIGFPVGAVLGHIALRQVRETGEEGEGYAKTGIIVGWIGTGLGIILCVGYVALFATLFNTLPSQE